SNFVLRISCLTGHEAILRKQFADRVARAHAARNTVGAEERGRWDAKGGEERGPKILGRDGLVLHLPGLPVGGAVDRPAADAAAGDHRGVAVGPMVAAGAGVDLWGAAELA